MNGIGTEPATGPRIVRMLRECTVSGAPALLLAAGSIALLAILGLGASLP